MPMTGSRTSAEPARRSVMRPNGESGCGTGVARAAGAGSGTGERSPVSSCRAWPTQRARPCLLSGGAAPAAGNP